MAVFKSPGADTFEYDESQYTSKSVEVSVPAFLGTATKGIVGVPVFCADTKDLVATFGNATSLDNDWGFAAAYYYLKNSKGCYFVRIADGEAQASSQEFEVLSATDESVTRKLSFKAETAGTDGNLVGYRFTKVSDKAADEGYYYLYTYYGDTLKDKVKVSFDPANRFFIGNKKIAGVSIEVDETLAQAFTLTYKVTSDNKVRVVFPGFVAGANGDPIADGTALTLSVKSGDSTTEVSGTYKNQDDKLFYAEFDTNALNTAGEYKAHISTKLYYKTADGVLEYVPQVLTITVAGDPAKITNLVTSESGYVLANSELEFLTKRVLAGGNDGVPADESKYKTALIGANVAGTTTGLQSLRDVEFIDINLIVLPGAIHEEVIAEAQTIANFRKSCDVIFDVQGDTPEEVVEYINGISGIVGCPVEQLNDSHLYTYFPACYGNTSGFNGGAINDEIPASICALAPFAVCDLANTLWKPPAGLERGIVPFATQPVVKLDKDARDLLYENHINPIIYYKGVGVVVWGQKTTQRAQTALDRVGVRRIMNYFERQTKLKSDHFVFEDNGPITWDKWVMTVSPIFDEVKSQGGIVDFRVIMDDTTVTPDDIENYTMPGKVLVKPTKAAEWIPVSFVLKAQNASF